MLNTTPAWKTLAAGASTERTLFEGVVSEVEKLITADKTIDTLTGLKPTKYTSTVATGTDYVIQYEGTDAAKKTVTIEVKANLPTGDNQVLKVNSVAKATTTTTATTSTPAWKTLAAGAST